MSGDEVDPTWNRLLDGLPRLRAQLPDRETVRQSAEAVYRRTDWPINLAVCAIFRNEARHLAEWVAFHRYQGVERFYLYDHGSTDDWQAAIEPYRDFVEVTRWPRASGQLKAYEHCVQRTRADVHWLAVIDLDEFIFSPAGLSLPQVVQRFSNVAAVAGNWRVYGTSGHEESPAGGILENFTERGPDELPDNAHVKSIVVPALVVLIYGTHHFIGVGPTAGEDGGLVESPTRTPSTADLLRVNHYMRSMTEFTTRYGAHRADGQPHPGRPDFAMLNSVHDPILADVSGLAGLLSTPMATRIATSAGARAYAGLERERLRQPHPPARPS